MRLLVNGDSFVFGDGLLAPDDPGPWISSGHHCGYSLSHSWPAILARALGWELLNLSVGLGSNDRMVRTTMSEICGNGHGDTLVILGWTDHFRREVHCLDHPVDNGYERGSRWLKLGTNSHNMSHVPGGHGWWQGNLRHGWDLVESTVRFCQQAMMLPCWLSSLGVPVINVTTLATPQGDNQGLRDVDDYPASQIGPLFNSVDWSSWIAYDGGIDNVLQRLALDADGMLPCGHPTQRAHVAIAEHIGSELVRKGYA